MVGVLRVGPTFQVNNPDLARGLAQEITLTRPTEGRHRDCSRQSEQIIRGAPSPSFTSFMLHKHSATGVVLEV